jgi:aromatic ring-opening dioxygenase catalytic subunit (LigB family)
MNPLAFVHASKYENYQLNCDVPMANRLIDIFRDNGIDAHANDEFDWIHDTFLILIRMFPNGCPPTTLISQNARYDPHWHMRIGSILRPLRKEGYLIIGTGGAVHNLYRNDWAQMVGSRDNFAMPSPPDGEMLEFRQAFEDAVTKNSGPALRRAVTRLMKHPDYRNAHGTDEHFIPATFVAGAAGDEEDAGVPGVFGAEDWELVSRCFFLSCDKLLMICREIWLTVNFRLVRGRLASLLLLQRRSFGSDSLVLTPCTTCLGLL